MGADYYLAFTTGLLGGSGHCIGMCGPIVASVAWKQRKTGDAGTSGQWLRQLQYHTGRIVTKYGNDTKQKLQRSYKEHHMEEKAPLLLTIAVLGGTGKEGKGLAYRWAQAGYKVLIGSRSPERAVTAASEIMSLLDGTPSIVGMDNHEAAKLADIVVLTVPYAAHRETLEGVKDVLKGKILVDVTSLSMPPMVTKVYVPPAGSAAQELQRRSWVMA